MRAAKSRSWTTAAAAVVVAVLATVATAWPTTASAWPPADVAADVAAGVEPASRLLAAVDVELEPAPITPPPPVITAAPDALEAPRSWTHLEELERLSEAVLWGPEASASGAANPCENGRLRLKTRVRGYQLFGGGNGAFARPLRPVIATGFGASCTAEVSGGVFTTTDPLGYVDGPNLYQYGLNNPVNFSDPMGEAAETVWDVASLGVGVTSLGYNIREGNFGYATLDVLGIIVDGAATATLFVPGGAGMALKASRAAGALGKARYADDAINASEGVVFAVDAYQEGDTGWAVFYGGMSALGVRGMDASPFKIQARGMGSNLGNLSIVPKQPGSTRSALADLSREDRQKLIAQKVAANRARLRSTGSVKNVPGYRLSATGNNRRWRRVDPVDSLARHDRYLARLGGIEGHHSFPRYLVGPLIRC